ncbi:MAG: DUF4438 domain-containing protein [Candidatus Dormiibacterota bacterium]
MRSAGGELVQTLLLGEVTSPELEKSVYEVDSEGRAFVPIGCGGVRYNVKVGMSAFGWAADQVQPGASIANPLVAANRALNTYSCVGNRVRVHSGNAAGAVGLVTGKHERFGGFQQVVIDLPQPALELLAPGDQVVVEAVGRGLAVDGIPAVSLHSLSPRLWQSWSPRASEGKLIVRVAQSIPGRLVGIGSGRVSATTSISIQTPKLALEREPQLLRLRLGDMVAISDWDAAFNTGYREGSSLIGVVVHGSSRIAGQGVGLTILMSGRSNSLVPELDPDANLVSILGIQDHKFG